MSTLQTVKLQSKYGLISKKPAASSSSGSNPLMKKPRPSIFSDDDALEAGDDDDDANGEKYKKLEIQRVNKEIMAKGSRIAADTAKLYQEALQSDASVFDYDGAYDSFKATATAQSSQLKAKSTAPPVSFVGFIFFIAYFIIACLFRNHST
jgi:hypothetical protein